MGNPLDIVKAVPTVVGLFKKDKKSNDAGALAAAAPTQTADQAEISSYLKPYLKDWMTKPPELNAPIYQPTRIQFGDEFGYSPGGASFFGAGGEVVGGNTLYSAPSGGSGQPGSAPVAPVTSNLRIPNYHPGGAPAQKKGSQENNASKSPSAPSTSSVNGFPSPGRTFNYQPGTLTLSRMPTSEMQGSPYGGFQPSGYLDEISSYMIDIDPLSFMPDRTSEINQAFDASGIRNYKNSLEGDIESKIRENMSRTLQEGYTSDYLKELAAAGIDPLKEAFDEAQKRADADYNRMGMRASGFQWRDKNGPQSDSITSRYLKEVGNVYRDVGLRGAEAAREDRFRNASLQDQATQMGMSLSGRQSDDQFRRENSYLAGLQGALDARQRQDVSRSAIEAQNKEIEAANKERQAKGIGMKDQMNRANEAERQWWTNQANSNIAANNTARANDWLRELSLGQWLAGRDDQAMATNQARDLNTQEANIGYQQNALDNLMRFSAGQAPQASAMNRNYWDAQTLSDQRNSKDAGYLQELSRGLGGLFKNQDPLGGRNGVGVSMNDITGGIVNPVNSMLGALGLKTSSYNDQPDWLKALLGV